MNQDQILSLARTVLKLASGYALSKGIGDSSAWEGIVGGILAAIGIFWSHYHHGTDGTNGVDFKKVLLIGLIGLTGLMGGSALTGCSASGAYTIAPGSDAFVVNSEHALGTSLDAIDGFLHWEFDNRAHIDSEITRTADAIRENAPKAFWAAENALSAYKHNRNADNKATFDTALAVLLAISQEAKSLTP